LNFQLIFLLVRWSWQGLVQFLFKIVLVRWSWQCLVTISCTKPCQGQRNIKISIEFFAGSLVLAGFRTIFIQSFAGSLVHALLGDDLLYETLPGPAKH